MLAHWPHAPPGGWVGGLRAHSPSANIGANIHCCMYAISLHARAHKRVCVHSNCDHRGDGGDGGGGGGGHGVRKLIALSHVLCARGRLVPLVVQL